MKLKTITCSGANEYTDIDALLKMCQKYPKSEVGIQVSGKKASFGSARYWWIETLLLKLKKNNYTGIPAFALHVNADWVERFGQGNIPKELNTWLNWKKSDGSPVFGRIQLNFKIGRDQTPDVEKIIEMSYRYAEQRFILSYNPENAEIIQELYEQGMNFDLLTDSSHGEGIMAESYPHPIYKDTMQGYSGGLSAENVAEQLNKISKVVPVGRYFWIDAEGKLKGEDGHLSLEKCESYLKQTSRWDAV